MNDETTPSTEQWRVRAVEIAVERLKILEESQRRALEKQAAEYERRLEELNHEAIRIRSVQIQSVTAEKFEDYKNTQGKALELALKSSDDKFTALAQNNARSIHELSDRVLRLEGAGVARDDKWEIQALQRQRHSARLNGWLIAGLGAVMTFIVIIVNLFLGY